MFVVALFRLKNCAKYPIFLQVGYHNEHHDFPSVPWTRLPKLRALAPEVYNAIPSHPSWPMVIINFIFDDDVGMFSRVKRHQKSSSARNPRDSSISVPDKSGSDAIDSALDEKLVSRAYADSDSARLD